jgi:phage I-like protein
MLQAIGEAKMAADSMAQIRGWCEVAKMLGYYAPERKEVKLSATSAALSAKYEAMSDDELLAIANGATEAENG